MITYEMGNRHRKRSAIFVFIVTALCTATPAFVEGNIEHVCSAEVFILRSSKLRMQAQGTRQQGGAARNTVG